MDEAADMEQAWNGRLEIQLGTGPPCAYDNDVGTAGFNEVYYDAKARVLLFYGIVNLMDGGADLAWVDARSCETLARTNTGPLEGRYLAGTCNRQTRVEPGKVIIQEKWDGPARKNPGCRQKTVIPLAPACRPTRLPPPSDHG
jgi:hypothetical protein